MPEPQPDTPQPVPPIAPDPQPRDPKPHAPPIEEERGPQVPVELPGQRNAPERVGA